MSNIEEARASVPASAPVLIVGSGAVGLTMALDLAERGIQVIVLEAGDDAITQTSQQFFKNARNIGKTLDGLHLGRFRALGGSTNFWGGQLVRFDPVVFEDRPWVHGSSKWPFRREDLDPYYDHALKVLGMGNCPTSDKDVFDRLGIASRQFPAPFELFLTRWMPEPNMARLFRHKIQTNPALQVITGAPVSALIGNDDGTDVIGAHVQLANGDSVSFTAPIVVLANGTIEITRLLMLPFADGRRAAWHSNSWLGRGFMDHLGSTAGRVTPIDKKKFHHTFDNALIGGYKYQPKIKMTDDAQRQSKTLNISAFFSFKSNVSEDLANAKILLRGLMRGNVSGSLRDIGKRIRALLTVGVPMAIRYVKSRRIYSPNSSNIELVLFSEQSMISESRIVLGPEMDSLGMPIVSMDWQVRSNDLGPIADFATALAATLEQEGLAKIDLDPQLVARAPAYLASATDTYHQMGMARMGQNAAEGVVDANLAVFGSKSLYVAGAATFPSTGFANPTFTAMALGMRLTERLAGELRP